LRDEDKRVLIERKLKEKRALVDNSTFVFPVQRGARSDNKRRFQLTWLTMHEWLIYSEADHGGYCLLYAFST